METVSWREKTAWKLNFVTYKSVPSSKQQVLGLVRPCKLFIIPITMRWARNTLSCTPQRAFFFFFFFSDTLGVYVCFPTTQSYYYNRDANTWA
jgi:hypothetical protein